jgi:Helicase conserved C-terminal domain
MMARVFLVRQPVGTGKTRGVLKHLLTRGKASVGRWNARLRGLIILGPNDHVERTWLRELLLLAGTMKLSSYAEEDVRSAGNKKLRDLVEGAGLVIPRYYTYGQVGIGESRRCRYVILDEWHRLPQRIRAVCSRFALGHRTARPWFLAGHPRTKSVYLVSATPVNPVREREDKDLAEVGAKVLTDDEFRELCREATVDALSVIRTAVGRPGISEGSQRLFDVTADLGVKDLKCGRRKWLLPRAWKIGNASSNTSLFERLELEAIERHLESDDRDEWRREYVSMVGLVRTRSKNRRIPRMAGAKRSRTCFGFRYRVLHHPVPPTRMDARKWLSERHTRLPRLRGLLCDAGVLQKVGDGLRPTGKKVLVFCIHRGVALGLARSLQFLLDEPSFPDDVLPTVVTNADTALGSHRRKSPKLFAEELVESFSAANKPPFILVATDILSESLDLHHACRLLIHYELPWSPLRLFQRIGRLTRLKSWGNRVIFNSDVRVAHIIIPGSVEEERVNRLIRRTRYLIEEELWPKGYSSRQLLAGLIGNGPSLHYAEEMAVSDSRLAAHHVGSFKAQRRG